MKAVMEQVCAIVTAIERSPPNGLPAFTATFDEFGSHIIETAAKDRPFVEWLLASIEDAVRRENGDMKAVAVLTLAPAALEEAGSSYVLTFEDRAGALHLHRVKRLA